jgi:hypothetical protein
MQKHDHDVEARSRLRPWAAALLVASALVVGCLFGRSEEDVKAEFESFVAQNNHCTAATDCAIAGASCPLGCFVAVRSDRKAAVEAKARELVEEYERGGQRCDYDCVPAGQLACDQNRCATTSAP